MEFHPAQTILRLAIFFHFKRQNNRTSPFTDALSNDWLLQELDCSVVLPKVHNEAIGVNIFDRSTRVRFARKFIPDRQIHIRIQLVDAISWTKLDDSLPLTFKQCEEMRMSAASSGASKSRR
jgi:hypothetical protein